MYIYITVAKHCYMLKFMQQPEDSLPLQIKEYGI